MLFSSIILFLTIFQLSSAQLLYPGQTKDEFESVLWQVPECQSLLSDWDWTIYDTTNCDGATCNYPQQACFEDANAWIMGNPDTYMCRDLQADCYAAAVGGTQAPTTATTTVATTTTSDPNTVRGGTCPAPYNTPSDWCWDFCDQDSDCWEGEKCCFDGCSKQCTTAITDSMATTTTTQPTTATTKATTSTTSSTTSSTSTTTTTSSTSTSTEPSTTTSTTSTTSTATAGSTTQPKSSSCSEPLSFGLGINPQQRYYFNGVLCYPFIYLGGLGNNNNFESMEACESACVRQEPDCFANRDVGTGNNYRTRFYYTGNYCGVFWYKGTGGNTNNFESKQKCEENCLGATRSPQTTTTVASTTTTTPTTTTTTPTTTIQVSVDRSACLEERHSGIGRNWQRRYYWTGSSCENFWYAGSGGTRNNFETVEQCQSTCQSSAATTTEAVTQGPSTCSLSRDKGSGTSWSRRYYFDGQQCVIFWYSGTGGNANNFESIADCESTCLGGAVETTTTTKATTTTIPTTTTKGYDCSSSRDTGSSCTGCSWSRKYYYDAKYKSCIGFWYAGSGGNDNNYDSHDKCISACMT